MGATREHSGRGKKKGKDSYLEQAGDTCVIQKAGNGAAGVLREWGAKPKVVAGLTRRVHV